MCGLSGVIDFNKKTTHNNLKAMIHTLDHRGPDSQNTMFKVTSDYTLGMSHARLAVVDLSAEANQPMNLNSYHIVFNGEIYNYREIKSELIKLGHTFNLDSDTEVILHAFDEWGVKCIDHFIGIFAFVIYDSISRKVHLFRDRVGAKPLYYYFDGTLFIFASELKAICKHPDFNKEIDNNAVGLYFKYGSIPAPYSIYKNTSKIKPGHYISLNLNDKSIDSTRYWNAQDFYQKNQFTLTYDEAKQELHSLLKSACNYRMVADVPVGVFLSGGYDSTAVAAILQKNSQEKLKTFTIGFVEGNNEAPFAKEIAEYLGTEHTEFICRSQDAKEIIQQLPFYYDEPFSDSSAIPTLLVSKLASNKVKVVLSSDGGDEQFCGYNSYRLLDKYLQRTNKLKFLTNGIGISGLKLASSILAKRQSISHKIDSTIDMLKKSQNYWPSMLHEGMQSAPTRIVTGLLKDIQYPQSIMLTDVSAFHDAISVANLLDYQNYLPNDILVKVDRATVSASIEGREPLLDHRILEFAARLPTVYKYDGITSKKILKDIVYEYVPKKIMDRPKTGFTIPIYGWLRADLSYLLEDYLSIESLKKSGIFNIDFTLDILDQFKNNKLRDESLIWKILQFQMWYRTWMP